jgi:hypothetical protein
MSDAVRKIADAVLYEGYLLWPYRKSAAKNQQRWTLGCIMPPAWTAEHGEEPDTVAAEVLVEGGTAARLSVVVRFLHVVHRQVFDTAGFPVDELVVGGERHISWDEATERELATPGPFVIEAGARRDAVPGGTLEHRWERIEGDLHVDVEPLDHGLQRLSVRVRNTTPGTPWTDAVTSAAETSGQRRNLALPHALCSAHLVLRTGDGAFLSPLDPRANALCRQDKLWPVLVGEAPDRSTILASAIVLEEYPRIAPESPGDLFDGGEVDQLLTLNILGMTDDEKAEMRASDPRARAILERTEAMTAEDLMRLHGTIRDFMEIGHR